LLVTETRLVFDQQRPLGRWRFLLTSADGSQRVAASDCEPGTCGERLELLAVVRGLEALDRPAHVTLLTDSLYVRGGLQHGLRAWRENGWRWERFGELVPVKHQDLWKRVNRALQFHSLNCRTWRIDRPHATGAPRHAAAAARPDRSCDPAARDRCSVRQQVAPRRRPLRSVLRSAMARTGRWLAAKGEDRFGGTDDLLLAR